MTDAKFDLFLSRLRVAFPDHPVIHEPYEKEGDPNIRYYVHVLCVPNKELRAASHRAWNLAFEIFGEHSIPFFLTPLTPKTSAEYFSEHVPASSTHRTRVRTTQLLLSWSQCERYPSATVSRVDPASLTKMLETMLARQWSTRGAAEISTSIRARSLASGAAWLHGPQSTVTHGQWSSLLSTLTTYTMEPILVEPVRDSALAA